MKRLAWLFAAAACGVLAGQVAMAADAPAAAAPEKAAPAAKLKVVVLTGGHGFEEKQFSELWATFTDMDCTQQVLKDDSETFEDVTAFPYDVIAFYNMTQKISPKRQKNLQALLDKGVGIVGLHHSIGNFQGWPGWYELIGGKFFLGKTVVDGVERGPSGWQEGLDMKIHIEDADHPITRGMSDFTIHDEVYNHQLFDARNHLLLSTDHPKSDKPIAWTRQSSKSRVVYIQLGHGARAYENPNYRRFVHRAIQWTANREIQDLASFAGPKGAVGMLGAAAAAADKAAADEKAADPAALLKQIAAYQVDQSRVPLTAMEALLRDSAKDPARRAVLRNLVVTLLTAPATADARMWACRQLAVIGTAEEIPVLAKMLSDKDSSLAARTALEAMPYPQALAALRDALGQVKGPELVGVINSLGVRRDAQSVAALGKLSAAGDDPEVARAAVAALGKIGGAEAAKLLESVPASPALAASVAEARLRVTQQLLADSKKDDAAAIYKALSAEAMPRHIRVAALAGLVEAQGDAALPAIQAALTGTDAALQGQVASLVRTMPAAQAGKLADQLGKLPACVQIIMLEALSDRSDTVAGKAISELISASDPAVRAAALRAVGRVGDVSSLGVLLRMALKGPKDESAAAQEALIRLKGADVNVALAGAALQSAGPAGRCLVIKVLAARGATECSKALLPCAKDADAAVRAEAFVALAALADDKAVGDLLALVAQAKDDADREAAARAVEAACLRSANKDACAELVLGAAAKADKDAKVALLRVLGRLAGPKALQAVRAALADADAAVQDAAVRALAAWPDLSAGDDLLNVAKTSANETHRVLALRGYLRLLAIPAPARESSLTARMYQDAMAAARRAEDKKMVLSGLSAAGDAASLDMVVQCLGQEGIEAEAAATALRIANQIKGRYPAQVRTAMQKLADTCKDAAAVGQAKELVEQTRRTVVVAANLALAGVASNPDDIPSDGQSGPPQAAIDDDPVSYFDQEDGKPLYRLAVTFRQAEKVCAISILGYAQHNYAPKDFEILCDGKVVKAVTNAVYDRNVLIVTFPEVACKVLEIKTTGYYGASPGIREMGIYGPKTAEMIESQIGSVEPSKDGKQQIVTVKRKQLENGAWIVTRELKP